MAEIETADRWHMCWTPKARLPSEAELHQAIDSLTVPPVSAKHAGQCLARLTLAFEAGTSKLSDEQIYQRARVWREANGDLGDELWSEATLWCLRHHKFGMPRPAEFRASVGDRLVERQRKLDRCRRLLAHVEKAGPRTPEDEEREERERENELLRTGPPDVQRRIRAVRVRELIDIFTRHGMTERATANQALLDAIEREQRAAGEIEEESERQPREDGARADVTARDGHPEDVTARDGQPGDGHPGDVPPGDGHPHTRGEARADGETQ